MADVKIIDESHKISDKRGNGKLRREVWVDEVTGPGGHGIAAACSHQVAATGRDEIAPACGYQIAAARSDHIASACSDEVAR